MINVSILFTILCFLASVHLRSQNKRDIDEDEILPILHSFDEWKLIHGKSYSFVEEKHRKKIFDERCERIKEHNKRYKLNEVTYTMGLNAFSDLSREEFRERMNIRRSNIPDIPKIDEAIEKDCHISRRVKRQTPSNFDWRTSSKVTIAQDQGWCGSGYAFAAIAAIESQVAIHCGPLIRFSEEQIVECSGLQGNNNCTSGTAPISYRYLISTASGVCTSASYPYTSGASGDVYPCRYTSTMSSQYKVTSYTNLAPGESSLLSAVSSLGPVSVYMSVDFDSFFDYSSGIWNEPACTNLTSAVDHYMVVVGYGVNSAGQAFWTIKNSWGTTWGTSGFLKVPRNNNNKCCVACLPSIPTVSCN